MRSKKALEEMNDYLTNKFLDTAHLLEKLEYEFSEMQKNSAVTEDRVNRLDVSHAELSEKCKALILILLLLQSVFICSTIIILLFKKVEKMRTKVLTNSKYATIIHT